jgi:hypothetical protein
MTMSQTAEMMAILRAAYPRFYVGMTREDASAALNLWHGFFADDDASLVSDAVKAFIASDTKGFPPVVGQIREKLDVINQAVHGFELTPQTAWGLVKRAMKDSAYHSAEQFAELPEVVQEVVGSPSQLHEWAVSNDGVSESVIASNFQRSFAARAAVHKEIRMMPGDVRARIDADRKMIAGMQDAPRLQAASDDIDEYAKQLREMTPEERHKYFESIKINLDEEE